MTEEEKSHIPITAASTTQSTLHIPTIDIAAYLQNPKSSAAEEIISGVRDACVATGFFQITGHTISRKLQEQMFTAAKAFFALPYEVKMKLDAKTVVGHRGYDVLASQSYDTGVLPDLKEGFYMALDVPLSDPRVLARRIFMGRNVWPPTQLIPPEEFRNTLESYYKAVFALSMVVLDIIARTLPYGSGVFDDFKSHEPLAPFRLLHYPPGPTKSAATDKRQLGASAHTDFGAITLLLQDEQPGLEVLEEATGAWHLVKPNPDAYVVNIGDMLSKWTANRYKSSVHRVINNTPNHRYSAVFFFDGNLDCPLAPLDGSKTEAEVLTVEKHMLARMAQSYGPKEEIAKQ